MMIDIEDYGVIMWYICDNVYATAIQTRLLPLWLQKQRVTTRVLLHLRIAVSNN